ncbi:hypothetical protein C2S51_023140 [Perilla frutescens var. frutescens]|nr:hypothetical protein C2S51_023140 [Perilla frutescens var. frutescens]
MGSFSGLGIGLSCVFAFILMGLVAELCYLLWWKKRTVYSTNTKTENLEKFSFQLCWNWKKPDSVNGGSSRELTNSVRNQFEQEDLETGSGKLGYGEEGVESELMRMHNLCGPPRFLFTIKEESKEDLESDDGKSRSSNCKGLNDHIFGGDGLKGSNLRNGNNPVLESMTEAEMNKLRSSPPPTFKFLKDAEDKFLLMQEAGKKESESAIIEGINGDFSFVKVSKPAAQVMPLASSPIFSDKKSLDLP